MSRSRSPRLGGLAVLLLSSLPPCSAGLLGQGGGSLAGAALRGASGAAASGEPWYRTRARGFDPARDALAFGNGDFDIGHCHGLALLNFHVFRTVRFSRGASGLSPRAWLRNHRAGGPRRNLVALEGARAARPAPYAGRLLAQIFTMNLDVYVRLAGPHDGLVSFSASPGGKTLLKRMVEGVPTGFEQATNFGIKGNLWDSNRTSARTIGREIARTKLPQVVSFVDLKPVEVNLGRALRPGKLLNPLGLVLGPTRAVRKNPGLGEGHSVLVYEAAPFDDRWELMAVDPQLSVQPEKPPKLLRIRVWDESDRIDFHWVQEKESGVTEEAVGIYQNLQSMFPFDASSLRRRHGVRRWFLRKSR